MAAIPPERAYACTHSRLLRVLLSGDRRCDHLHLHIHHTVL